MRPIMTRAELASHEVGQHGRDYSRSDDGWDDMEVAAEDGWHAVSGWGRDGYDLGDWPYVVISVRDTATASPGTSYDRAQRYQMRQTVEGDTTVYAFRTPEDRAAAIDYLFIWYGIGREYEEWAVLGVPSTYDAQAGGYHARHALDAGTLRVPEQLRGPFSWKRLDAETVA